MINSRDRYYTRISNKLTDSHVFPKAFCSILKMLLNSENLWLFHLCSMKTGLEQIFKRRLN